PSRLPFYIILASGFTFVPNGIAFSPDGRLITFIDTGPDAAGNEAAQVITLDVASGERRQVTHLPAGIPPVDRPNIPSVVLPAFIDSDTIGFYTDAYGLTPTGNIAPYTVSLSDGTVAAAQLPVALQGSVIDFSFAITGDKPTAIEQNVPGRPKNSLEGV